MRTVTPDDLRAAETFMQLNARLIDRLRFACHFRGGSAEPVVAALRPYQNADGGFGNALEPDLRGASSQPVPAQHALEILDEVDRFGDPMVQDLCTYLVKISRGDGGVPFVLPAVRNEPRGPWWQTGDDPPGSLIPTGTLAGAMHKRGVNHSWLDQATQFCWQHVEALETTSPYEAYAVIPFLEHVPDRDRARAAFDRIRGALLACVELDPDAAGEVHLPLDFAVRPDSLARQLFTDEVVDAHLDALVGAQRDDGGWDVNFPIWTPITGPEWRGWMTVHTLLRLRAYGRLTS